MTDTARASAVPSAAPAPVPASAPTPVPAAPAAPAPAAAVRARPPPKPPPLLLPPVLELPSRKEIFHEHEPAPLVHSSEFPVRMFCMWCRDEHLEQHISDQLFRACYEMQMLFVSMRCLGSAVIALTVTSQANQSHGTAAFCVLFVKAVVRRRLHLMSDPQAARRLGVWTAVAFDISWRLFVSMRQQWTGREAYPISDPHESPWVILVLASGLFLKLTDLVSWAPLSSPAVLAARLLLISLYLFNEGGLDCIWSQTSPKGIAIVAVIGGAVASWLAELLQRMHMLTVLQMQQAAMMAVGSKRVTREERRIIEDAFNTRTLPPALLRARIDLVDLVWGNVLGSGAFGTVRLATWRSPYNGESHKVAAKSLHRSRISAPSMASLIRALEVEVGLPSHSNIVRLLGVAWASSTGSVVVVSEYCAGGTLHSAISTGASKMWPQVQKLLTAAGIADGLAFLHGLTPPVLHRDLKPENILFGKAGFEGEPKIADFGEARCADETMGLMTAGRGTPYFAAPEQLTSKSYDTPADVWALGCVLTCIETDSIYPYHRMGDETSGALVSRIIAGRLVPSLRLESTMSSVVHNCCQYAPLRRASADAILSQLSKAARLCSLSHLSHVSAGGGADDKKNV